MARKSDGLSGVFVVEATPEGWHIHFVSRTRYLLNAPEKQRSFQAGFYGKFESEGEAFMAATHLNALLALASNYVGDAP